MGTSSRAGGAAATTAREQEDQSPLPVMPILLQYNAK
jgi:hypothetical protein